MEQLQIDPAIQAFSLKETCKSRIKGMFVSLRKENPNVTSYLLIVDEKTVKIVSAYMKMAELMELGVIALEKLELGRKPFPKMHAIYFITPSEVSVNHLLSDYADKKNPQYGVVHLIFSNEVPHPIMTKIAQCEALITRVQTFKIFNLDFACAGETVYTLEMFEALTTCFSTKGLTQQTQIKIIAHKLSTLLISFEKFYSFELIYNVADNHISEEVAKATQTRLQELFQTFQKVIIINNSEQYDTANKSCGKISLLIIDRTYDVATPLLHDFFYQPMIYDLLDVQNNVCEYEQDVQGKKVAKKVVLSDDDDLFKRYKYRHIGEVLEGVPLEFRNFVNNNTTAKVQQGQMQNLDLSKMSEIVKSMPQYNELLNKYTLHMKLIDKSWGIFEKKDLKDIGDLEQSLATGLDRDGKNISPIKILNQVGLKILNESLDDFDKLRLLLITTICLEMVEKDRKTLTDKIKYENQKALLNLIHLGVNPQKGASKKGKSSNRVAENIQKIAKNKMASATLDLCRNTPLIETLVEQFVEGGYKKPLKFDIIRINEDGMNSNQKKNSVRKKGKLAKMMQNEVDSEAINDLPKLIVFVIGGIGYNEIRCIQSNPKIISSQITIVGGTSLLKPNDYCKGLLEMKTE